jgi:predicted phosphoribosyltransferase
MNFRFQDRSEAGRLLALKLKHYEGRSDVVVLAVPRGGVPVGFEVAGSLCAPMDVFVVRKLGMPGHEEFALGAIASGGVSFLNEKAIEKLRVSREVIEAVMARERLELDRQERIYRKYDRAIDVKDQTVVLVDDGLATGASMQAAVRAVRQRRPARIVVAVPVAAPDTCIDLAREVDEFVCVQTPDPFFAVGTWYDDFSQIGDEEVRALLEQATRFQQVIPA